MFNDRTKQLAYTVLKNIGQRQKSKSMEKPLFCFGESLGCDVLSLLQSSCL